MSDHEKMRKPFTEGIMTSPLTDLKEVKLIGTECRSCNEVFLGKVSVCKKCQNKLFNDIILSDIGKLFSYSIVRHQPPGEYKGQPPPFAVGLIELPEGLRIFAPLEGSNFEKIKIGSKVKLVIHKLFEDEDGNDIISYRFKIIS